MKADAKEPDLSLDEFKVLRMHLNCTPDKVIEYNHARLENVETCDKKITIVFGKFLTINLSNSE